MVLLVKVVLRKFDKNIRKIENIIENSEFKKIFWKYYVVKERVQQLEVRVQGGKLYFNFLLIFIDVSFLWKLRYEVYWFEVCKKY